MQFGVWNHGEACASPCTAREGEGFPGGEKEDGKGSKQRAQGFSLAESLPGKKSSLSTFWALLLLQGVRAPPSGLRIVFNWGFCLLIFYRSLAWVLG